MVSRAEYVDHKRPAAFPAFAGLLLTGGIAATAILFREATGIQTLSPLILSIVMGMVIGNIRRPSAQFHSGITFSLKRLLRIGIVLLGLQITVPQLLSLGLPGLLTVTVTLAASFIAVTLMGQALGVDRHLTGLIAAGTSVCGASAIIAANAAIRGREEDVAYAVACVTIFGTLSMLAYPLLMLPLHLSPTAYGIWSGATIHEVAQVVAATFQSGEIAGQFGTIAKLARIVLLAPLVMTLALTLFRSPKSGAQSQGAAPFPLFVLGFLAVVTLNSAVHIPPAVVQHGNLLATFLLSCGLAAMGLQTHIKQLAAEGLRPLLLAAFGWLFISGFGYLMVRLASF